jgi:DNA-damage-inducible protein D
LIEIEKYNENTFEKMKHSNEYGEEFWYARDMQEVLQYKKWGNFLKVIEKAKLASDNSGNSSIYHFAEVGNIIIE